MQIMVKCSQLTSSLISFCCETENLRLLLTINGIETSADVYRRLTQLAAVVSSLVALSSTKSHPFLHAVTSAVDYSIV